VYPDAWWHLGECYTDIGDYDGAVIRLRISDGLNPYNATPLNNLGVAYMFRVKFAQAEKALLKACSVDTTGQNCLGNLVMLYQLTGELGKYEKYLVRSTSDFDVPPDFHRAIVEYYVFDREFRRAARALQNALDRGIDSSRFQPALQKNAQQNDYLMALRGKTVYDSASLR